MGYRHMVQLSGILYYILCLKTLAASDLFDDVGLLSDRPSLDPEDVANVNTKPLAQDFFDDTNPTAASTIDGDLNGSLDIFHATSSLSANVPSSIFGDGNVAAVDPFLSSSIFSEDLISPTLSGSATADTLADDLNCAFNPAAHPAADGPMLSKRESNGDKCPAATAPSPAPSFDRGSSDDPEFYGVPLLGYTLDEMTPDDEQNECRPDIFELPQYLVCDSGENDDRMTHYWSTMVIATSVTLRDCEKSMSLSFLSRMI